MQLMFLQLNPFNIIRRGTQAEGVSEYGSEENIGPKRDEVTGEWRRIHNEELNDLYPHQILFG